jgi:hypothetical protein
MGESRVENPERQNRWGNKESKMQTEKTDGGIKSRKTRQKKPMGESRVKNLDKKTDGGIKSRKSRQRKPMGESRVENLDKENRWGNQETKI